MGYLDAKWYRSYSQKTLSLIRQIKQLIDDYQVFIHQQSPQIYSKELLENLETPPRTWGRLGT